MMDDIGQLQEEKARLDMEEKTGLILDMKQLA